METFQGLKTYIGIIVTIAPVVLSLFGYVPTPAFNMEFPEAIAAGVSLAGAAFAFYGRLKAQTPGWLSRREITKVLDAQ